MDNPAPDVAESTMPERSISDSNALLLRWAACMEDHSCRTPEEVRPLIPGFGVRADARYGDVHLVFIDGAQSGDPDGVILDRNLAARLRDAGFRLVRFGHPDDWSQTIDAFVDVIGEGDDADWDGTRQLLVARGQSDPKVNAANQDSGSDHEQAQRIDATDPTAEVAEAVTEPHEQSGDPRKPIGNSGESLAAPQKPLPPNVERALQVLEATGALLPSELRDALAEHQIVFSLKMIESLPDRFPHRFVMVDGRMDLALRQFRVFDETRPTADDAAKESPEGEWWIDPPKLEPLHHDRIVVVDIETTGLDRRTDFVWQIAARNLGSGAEMEILVEVPVSDYDNPSEAIPIEAALARLDDFLSGAQAVAGQRVGEFDIPFLTAQATRMTKPWSTELPLLDLHLLSLLVDPGLSSRTLSDLADAFEVPLTDAHDAVADTRATAELIGVLLDRIDPDDPTWQLAQRFLWRAGNAWARLIPGLRLDQQVREILQPRPDPLASAADGARFGTADSAVQAGFERMHAADERLRPRPGQREMAQRAAGALDRGERLAVEAPTGTGKSLGYLMPAAGRAGRRGQAVVVATHTKVLQRQLRSDAQRLRDLGLLPAPFRQIQGVSNYLCTREIAASFSGDATNGNEWVAVAVAVRALATSPSGVWDDVGDGLRQRTDLAYARQRMRLRTTANGCERKHCEWVTTCPLFQRLEGLADDPGVVSANHALVASWAKLTAEGGTAPGNLLESGKSALVFDEAHNLEDSLTKAWTDSTGGVDLEVQFAVLWGRDGPIRIARSAAKRMHIEPPVAFERLDALRHAAVDVLDQLAQAVATYLHEYAGSEIQIPLLPGIVRTRAEFRQIGSAALSAAQVLQEVCGQIRALMAEIRQAALSTADSEAKRLAARAARLLDGSLRDVQERVTLLRELREQPEAHIFLYLLGQDSVADGDLVDDEALAKRWLFQRTPIEIGDRFSRGIVAHAHAVVLTSATLTVGDSFAYIGGRLGVAISDPDDGGSGYLPPAGAGAGAGADQSDVGAGVFDGLRVDSPFDHDQQSALILTSHLPLPTPSREREFCEEVAADQVGFLSLTGGRALTLFAARTRMQAVAELVRDKADELASRGVRLLVQGEDTPGRIAEQFRSDPGTVVYGLASYWEGFDAPGDTLSYLTIEKPPYPHPGDPLVAARQRAITDRGGDPFLEYVVPLTAIRLAQGFGRLIRTETDRGAAVLYDRRVSLPTTANDLLLSALPTSNVIFADDRDVAWSEAITFVTGVAPDLTEAIALPVDRLADILAELQLAPGEDPTDKLQRAALAIFDVEHLRPFQLTLMLALLEGRDAMGFLPTGSGKSLVFQLPALIHPGHQPFVVVSPLVALIKDQVDELRSRRGLRAVAGITGRTSSNERTETLRDLAEGKVRLLYVSPERLSRDVTLREALSRQPLGALVVDEAHCISIWGHDFRPEFRMIAKAVLDFERSPRLALTATASPDVEQDIAERLQVVDPVVYREPVDRSDLRYWVRRVGSDRERTRELLRLILHYGEQPGLVYVTRRALADELAWILRQAGITARAYHAGLLPEQREAVQDDYLAGTTQVVVATKAFGMGVNKPDIKWVAHYDMPESLEAYAQEAGRAARAQDLTGECVLFFHTGDLKTRKRMVGRKDAGDDAGLAERVLAAIAESPIRGTDHVFDGEELAAALGIDTDVLNVVIARLEDVGNVVRRLDCSARGMISIGRREPPDPIEQRRYFDLMKYRLKARADTQKRIDFADAQETFGMDADELEKQLIDWSFRRFVSFHTTQRLWRVAITNNTIRTNAYQHAVEAWRGVQHDRLDAMIEYATESRCRRVMIATAFGDKKVACSEDSGRLRCDHCASVAAGEGGGNSPDWHKVPLSGVPDPEELVDVELVVLQAVRWACRFTQGKYGEGGLKTILLGNDTLGEGRPIGRGLLSCPQFGALSFLRNGQKRVDDATDKLIAAGSIAREQVSQQRSDQTHAYSTLVITDEGRALLGDHRG